MWDTPSYSAVILEIHIIKLVEYAVDDNEHSSFFSRWLLVRD